MIESQTEFFVDGRWVAAAGTEDRELIDPSSEEVIGYVRDAVPADMDRAVAAARRAFDEGPWPKMEHSERAEILRRAAVEMRKHTDEMAELLTSEMGSPISQSKGGQVPDAANIFEYYADLAATFAWSERRPALDPGNQGFEVSVVNEPVGVVAAIVPWNSPQVIAAMKLGPALLAGCTVIHRPSPEAVLNLREFVNAFAEAGLPDGVLNFVPAGPEVSEYLVTHPGVDKVTYTGSTPVGRRIGALCGGLIRRCSLELGGKSAAILLGDADLDQSMKKLSGPLLYGSGQNCQAPTRILAPRSRYDEVVDAIVETVDDATYGDPRDPATVVGPLATRRQKERVGEYIRIGLDEGATAVLGGGEVVGFAKGWYVPKTVFANVSNDMRIAQEEIFGPVYTIIPYDDVPDAVRIANDSEYGLAGSVWTADVAQGEQIAGLLRAGSLGVNSHSVDAAAPIGGFKASGIARERGVEGIYPFLETKAILVPVRD